MIRKIIKEILFVIYALLITIGLAVIVFVLSALTNAVFGKSFATESRIKIAVIDTGINVTELNRPYLCNMGHKDFTGTGLTDRHGHGTNIAGIIAKSMNAKKQCLVIIKFFDPAEIVNKNAQESNLNLSLQWAFQQKVNFVNYSGGGAGKNFKEKQVIQQMLDNGIAISVAAGNDHKDLSKDCYYYPACYAFQNKNFHVIGNGRGEYRSPTSNWAGPITEIEDGENVEGGGIVMTGTSQATAIFTGKLIYLPK